MTDDNIEHLEEGLPQVAIMTGFPTNLMPMSWRFVAPVLSIESTPTTEAPHAATIKVESGTSALSFLIDPAQIDTDTGKAEMAALLDCFSDFFQHVIGASVHTMLEELEKRRDSRDS